MSNKDRVVVKDAIVTKILPDTRYRVKIEGDFEVLCYPAGSMRKNYFKINRNDKVKIAMPLDDLTRGRIIYHYKKKRPSS